MSSEETVPVRVALVDDQALIRSGLAMLVDSQPDLTVVAEAGSGREAVASVSVAGADVVLMDVRMPEMDGIELARRASELDPDIKIMFITGFAAVALNSDSEAPKNAKVLAKPVHLRELVSEVNKLLAA